MIVTNQTTFDIYFGPLHLEAGIGQQLTVDDTTATSLYLSDDAVADALNNAYNAGKVTVSGQAQPFPRPTGVPQLLHGDGNPEGLVYAPQGSLYMRRDGIGADSLYVKTTGITLNTGWLAYGSAVGGAGTEWAYSQVTADVTGITATTEATAQTVIGGTAINYDGTRVKLEFLAPDCLINTGSANITFVFLRDTTPLGQAIWTMEDNGTKKRAPYFARFDTPSAASHTYKIAAFVSANSATVKAGTGASGTYTPAFLRVTKA